MALVSRWYLAPYEDAGHPFMPTRRMIVDRVTAQIAADGGRWSEAEANGVRATGPGWAIVKVRAEPATQALVAALPGVRAIPATMNPQTVLGSLTAAQRATLRTWLNDLGYDDAEIAEKLPADWTNVTLRQLFDFLVANNAVVAYSGGQYRFGRVQRKTIDQLDSEVVG